MTASFSINEYIHGHTIELRKPTMQYKRHKELKFNFLNMQIKCLLQLFTLLFYAALTKLHLTILIQLSVNMKRERKIFSIKFGLNVFQFKSKQDF